MRQGLVREAAFLPSSGVQHSLVLAAACDSVIVVSGSDAAAHRHVLRIIATLKVGDELVVSSLAVLPRRSGGVAAMVRNLVETGVGVRVVDAAGENTLIEPVPLLVTTLGHVADAEKAFHREPAPSHPGGSKNPLSKYQLDYARRMHTSGESLRAIGMLFQLAPNELWELLNVEAPDLDEKPAVQGDRLGLTSPGL